MVKNAEAAGFNPLTALRNGGSAGFTATTSPALSSSAYIGQAAGQAVTNVGNFLANFDPMADQKREAEYQLVQAQIANLNGNTATMFPRAPSLPGSFNVPSWGASNIEQRSSGKAGRLSSSALATGGAVESCDRTVTNPWNDGVVHPGYLDAEAFEARYGDSEIAQTLYGIRNASADMLHNIERWANSPNPLGKVTKLPDKDRSWWPSLSIKWRN